MIKRGIKVLAWMAAAAAAMPVLAQVKPVVPTTSGFVRGVLDGGVEAFLGIPYAKAPVGALRWSAPQRFTSSGTRDASRFGASCMQPAPTHFGPYTDEFLAGEPFSEDCLFVNIWAPAGHREHLPVLVWFHGGGFNSGSAAIPIYNGAKFASKGAIVVSVNYRLGVFGFLAFASSGASNSLSGNYGLLDQIAALQWVHDNVAHFGGDPMKITIAGQSAGASSVNDLILSPRARGLFERAIAESGSGMGVNPKTLAEAQALGAKLAKDAGVSDIAGLRGLSAARLIELASKRLSPAMKGPPPPIYSPNIDGVILPVSPDALGQRPVSPVPLLTGFNADEGKLMVASEVHPADFEQYVLDRYGDFAAKLLAVYPHSDGSSATASALLLARDRYMAGLVLWSEARSKASGQPLFLYMFDHPYPGPNRATFGTFHTGEVPFVFDQLSAPGLAATARDQAVAAQLGDYWLCFMRDGKPDPAGRPTWPDAARSDGLVMGLGDKVALRPAVSSPERLAIFREYVAAGGTLSLF